MSGRIRQIKPDFFSDPDVARLPIRARLTYIGLWTIADDAGWLPKLDAVELGHLLYGYESAVVRERWIIADLLALQEDGHLVVEPCGHGCIPTLPRHQRVSKDRRVEMHWKFHETQCRRLIPSKSDLDSKPPAPVGAISAADSKPAAPIGANPKGNDGRTGSPRNAAELRGDTGTPGPLVDEWKAHHFPGTPLHSAEFPTGKERNGKERKGTLDAREARNGDGLRAKLGDFEDVMAAKPVVTDDWGPA